MGISAVTFDEDKVAVSLAAHDTTYLVDFTVQHLHLKDESSRAEDVIADYVIEAVQKYEHEHCVKIVGAGVPPIITELSPTLCSRLWLQVDVIPLVLPQDRNAERPSFWEAKHVDEQADSMARKCVMLVEN
jgi:alpha,alpha-trehalose phosphorylase (configuration-retaining)